MYVYLIVVKIFNSTVVVIRKEKLDKIIMFPISGSADVGAGFIEIHFSSATLYKYFYIIN